VEILKKRAKLREKVIEDARNWAKSLPFKASVIMIGSYARGDFNLWSDVDIILISDFKGSPLKRLEKIDYPPGFEVIPLTVHELTALLKKGDPLAKEAMFRGIILRDDFNIEKLKNTLENRKS